MLRRSHGSTQDKPSSSSQPSFGGEKTPPHARQDRQASSVSRPLEGRQRPKKPGPSLLQVASPVWRGAPVCLRLPVFSRRLTGLLSRSPPTDTRPQARAYWAKRYLFESCGNARGFLRVRQSFSAASRSANAWRRRVSASRAPRLASAAQKFHRALDRVGPRGGVGSRMGNPRSARRERQSLNRVHG